MVGHYSLFDWLPRTGYILNGWPVESASRILCMLIGCDGFKVTLSVLGNFSLPELFAGSHARNAYIKGVLTF